MIVPTQRLQGGGSVDFAAPATVPFQDQSAQQIQQLGSSMTRTGLILDSVGAQMQDEVDTARAKEHARVGAERAYQTTTKFGMLVGKAAVDAREQTLKDLESSFREIGDGLDNDTQSERVRQALEVQYSDARSKIDAHAAKQAVVYDKGETRASLDLNKRIYSTDWNSGPGAEEELRSSVRLQVLEMADLEGYGPQQTQALMAEELASMHAGALAQMADKPKLATDYLTRHEKEIPPQIRKEMQRTIDQATNADGAARLAIQLRGAPPEAIRGFAGNPMDPAQRLAAQQAWSVDHLRATRTRLEEAFQKGESIDGVLINREVMDQTLARMDKQHGEARNLFAQHSNAVLEQARIALRDPANHFRAPEDVVPSDAVAELKASGLWDNLVSTGGLFFTTEDGHAAAEALTPLELSRASRNELIAAFRYRLGDTDLEKLLARQAHAVGDTKQRQEADRLISKVEEIEDFGRQALSLPRGGPLRQPDQKRLDEWRLRTDDLWKTHQDVVLKRQGTDQERTQFLRKELAYKVLQNGIPVPRSTIPAEEFGRAGVMFRGQPVRIQDLPTKVTDSAGVSLTREQVAALFVDMHKREPNMQELAEAMEAVQPQGPVTSMVPPMHDEAFQERVLRLGAGGKR